MAAALLVGNAALAADDVAPALPSAGTDRWTLSGFAFLALAYFGSKLVLELILQRY